MRPQRIVREKHAGHPCTVLQHAETQASRSSELGYFHTAHDHATRRDAKIREELSKREKEMKTQEALLKLTRRELEKVPAVSGPL